MSDETSPPAHASRPRPIEIQRTSGWGSFGLREVWASRELLWLLGWRDVKVRYKQTALGFGWALIPPILTIAAFSLVFGGITKIPSNGLPYSVFSYSGLLPYLLFSQALSRGATSLVGNSGLISKVYFPRMLVPLSSAISPLADFCFSFVVLLGLMACYGLHPGWPAFALPLFIVLAMVNALAVSLWLSAIHVKFRDVGFAIPFLTQIWMYLSPVIYPVELIPHKFRLIYSLNPMSGVIEGFRWGLVGEASPQFGVMAVSTSVVVVLLLGGMVYFKRTERTFVDLF